MLFDGLRVNSMQCVLFLFILASLVGIITVHSPIKQLHVVFRHGERAPTETYKNDPYINITWPGGWGHLTNRGKNEMYSLGLKLREIYSDFMPDIYFHKDVKMVSSYADRCLMSAALLLAALFPPKNGQIWNENLLWQPIPVHYVPRSQDNLIAMKAACPKYDEELKTVRKSGEIESINKENSELFDFLSKCTGQVIDNVGSVELLYNTLEIQLLHNLTLPQWVRNVSLEHMKSLAARSLAIFTETEYMKRMKGGVFLQQVISSMKSLDNSAFIFLYSAHDLTLVNILRTLGYKSVLKPGFGAFLTIELRNNSEIMLQYRDDLTSDGELVTVTKCGTPCLLKNFEVALEMLMPKNWTQECKL